ncbi:hypothetical protein [Stenotrophomonas sp. Marseille-Q4652]|uniref:hypothetical protein n=1 Tax=Stenotrophomonas sp. Marseille-Q4652 TaxID=2866595 RepID=UPI001CE4A86E|nr:hypothetical protein [Stenotrophomonas sp. Marseille-Q4652]
MKIGRLHIGKRETNEENRFTLASWQHRCGYWRWALWWAPAIEGMKLRFGPGMAMGTRYWLGRKSGHFSAWATIPVVGGFSFKTQPKLRHNTYWTA